MPMPMGPNGMPLPRPTPEQIQAMQRRLAEDAQKAGMSVPQFIEHIKKQAQEQQMRMRAAQQAGQQPGAQTPEGAHSHPHPHPHEHPHPQPGAAGRQVPITPGPPNPKALAVAKFLRNQDLKPRTSILNGERKDMFKGNYN
jgi:translocation protein SEC62